MHRGNIARRPLSLMIVAISLSLATLVPKPSALAGPQGVTGKWSFTSDLNTTRSDHTATLLPSGQVLVAGGRNDNGTLKSAELYDPASGIWSFTGNLNVARWGHTAMLLPDGRVLVAGGGNDGPNDIGSAELYDPGTAAWSFTGNLNVARFGHTATLLPDGRVLVAGGDGDIDATNSAELYDTSTGTWTITGSLHAARYAHTATLLHNGKVLIAGGATENDFQPIISSSELYDPSTGSWRVTGSLNTGRSWYTTTLLADGSVLAVGGRTFPCSGDFCYSSATGTAELYNPAARTWAYTGSLNESTSHAATLLVNGQVLVAGGSSEIYDPGVGAWRKTGSLNTARDSHTSTLLQNGNVLVAGGMSFGTTNVLRSAELFDPDAPAPVPVPSINGASVEGKKLIVLGGDFDDGAVILLNGDEQATVNDTQTPENVLIGKKAGRKIKPGDKIQVRNSTGALSPEFTFAGAE